MTSALKIFDFQPPSAATWFYFAALLAIALFFKFSRLLSFRNLDVLTIPLLVPGLLLLRDAADNWFGYLWLLCFSAYLLVRCFLDLSLVTRPALSPNLNLPGLAWLSGALFIGLIAVAVRQPRDRAHEMVNAPAAINQVQDQGEHILKKQSAAAGASGIDVPFWVARILALSCHLAVGLGLMFVAGWHFQDWHAGVAAAAFYLLLPYTALDVSGWHHVWPMGLIVWAIFGYRIPTLSGALLGLAAATTYFPLLLFPVWLSFYWRRGAGRFAVAFSLTGALCLAAVVWMLWLDDDLARSVQSALSLPDWQPWREPIHGTQGFWQDIHWAYRMPVFIAHLAMLGITAFWPSPKNLAHVLALSAAVIIGVQFWYADQGGIYVLWYLPLLLLLVFRPNLSDRRPLPIVAETDWLTRLIHWFGRLLLRLLRGPLTVSRVR
jgi:hypothetical protein